MPQNTNDSRADARMQTPGGPSATGSDTAPARAATVPEQTIPPPTPATPIASRSKKSRGKAGRSGAGGARGPAEGKAVAGAARPPAQAGTGTGGQARAGHAASSLADRPGRPGQPPASRVSARPPAARAGVSGAARPPAAGASARRARGTGIREAVQEATMTLTLARRAMLRTMTLRYVLIVLAWAVVRGFIPYPYEIVPTWRQTLLDGLMPLLAAFVCVNLAMRRGVVRPAGWAVAAVLLVPAMVGYCALCRAMGSVFVRLVQTMNIWTVWTIPLLAVRPLLQGVALLVIFLLVWKLAFGMSPYRRLNLRPVGHPLVIVGQVLGCVFVAYLGMVAYAYVMTGPVYGLLGQGPPDYATWYHRSTVADALNWLHKPATSLLYGAFLLPGLFAVRTGGRKTR